jgi:hypothetical protein
MVLPVWVVFGLSGEDLLSSFGGDKLKEGTTKLAGVRPAVPADSRGLSEHRAMRCE